MKKITVLTIALFATLGAFAQFNQGRMLVGGNLGFNVSGDKSKTGNTTVNHGTYTDFSLTPQFGYFIVNRFALGAGIDVAVSNYKAKTGDNKSTSTSVQFQPFARYYLKNKIFFQGQFGIGSGKDKFTNNNNQTTDSRYSLASWAFSAGYACFLNDNVAIEPMIGYGSTYTKYKDSNPVYKEITPTFFIKVGFQIYLGKK